MTLAELQAHVDQRSANLTKKKWKVAVGPTQERGFRIDGQKREVFVTEAWLASPDLPPFNFDIALSNIVWDYQTTGPWKILGLNTAKIFAPLAMAALYLQSSGALPPWVFSVVLGVSIVLTLIAGARLGVGLWFYTRSEVLVRKLLEATKDVERTRHYLTNHGSTPERLAKFEAIVREMGLESAQPAQG